MPEQSTAERLQVAADALAALTVRDPEIAERVGKLSATLARTAKSERELAALADELAGLRETLNASRDSAAAAQLAEVTQLLAEVDALQARLDAMGKEIAAHHVARVGHEAWLKRRCAAEQP